MTGPWQPIASAPKDGTRLLLYVPRLPAAKRTWGSIRVGKWDGKIWAMDMAGYYRTDATHWMPLPEPPHD